MLGFRRPFNKIIEHFANAEITKCRSKKDGCLLPGKIAVLVKLMTSASDQFDFIAKIVVLIIEERPCFIRIQPLNSRIGWQYLPVPLFKTMNGIGVEVINALEELPHSNWPIDGRRLNF